MIFEDPLLNMDGLYFKIKCQETSTKKRLQVFCQLIIAGSKTFVITTIRDMSHWLEIQKQKNLTLFKTQAFASAAHEFRNPLNAIIGSLEYLRGVVDMERDGQFYMVAKNSSQLMLNLVNDILEYAQIESNTFIINIAVL